MSKYVFVFLVVLLSVFGIYMVQTEISGENSEKNRQYSEYLSEATYDAAHVIAEKMNLNGHAKAMPDYDDRQSVVNVFFKTLSLDFGYVTDEDLSRLKIYVPVVALVDTDGYYICYNQEHTGSAGTKIDTIITPENTWTKKTGNYIVRYNLGTNVSVTDATTGRVVSGNYRDVYVEMGSPDELYEIGFSSVQNGHEALEGEDVKGDEESRRDSEINNWDTGTDGIFYRYQRETIIPETQEKIEYYINQHNKVAAEYHVDYTFNMPLTRYDDWNRMLKEPTCIAFMQGVRASNTRDYLNIFSIGGGDISKTKGIAYSGSDTRTYRLGSDDDGSGTGYVADGRDVANNSSEIHYVDSYSDGAMYYHEHWGDPLTGTGCYTVPVYHVHTKDCYHQIPHVHVNKNGQSIIGKTTITPEEGGGGGCYTIPTYHQHTEECYTNTYHQHFYYSVSGTKVFTNAPSIDASVLTWADFDGDGYLSGSATKTLPTINPRTGTNEWAEGDFFGCYTNKIMHYHNSSCYELKEETKTDVITKQIYHVHVQPDIYYRTAGNGNKGDVSTRTDFTYKNDDPFEYTAPISGKYTLEVWGGKGSAGNGSYTVANIELSAHSKLYVYVGNDVSGTTAYGGNSATYITTKKGAPPTDTSTVYVVAGGNGTNGWASTTTSDSRITTGVNAEKGYARISFGGQKMTPEEAMEKGAVAYYVDTTTSYTDESGTVIPCCYTAIYKDELGNEHTTYAEGYTLKDIKMTCNKLTYDEAYTKAKKESDDNGYSWDSDKLNEKADEYAAKTGTVIKTDNTTTRTYELKCNKVYEGFLLSCGLEEGDLEGRELTCGKVSATDEEEDPSKTKSVEYYSLSCGHKEGELVQDESPICGKLSEEDVTDPESAAYGLNATIEYYRNACGLTSGQRITKAQFEAEQAAKEAAGY